jgi:hypothetical protein
MDPYNKPLRPRRVRLRVTGVVSLDVDGVNAAHAEGQALVKLIVRCGIPSGSRVDPDTGAVSYPLAEPARPVEVELAAITTITVEGSTELPWPPA